MAAAIKRRGFLRGVAGLGRVALSYYIIDTSRPPPTPVTRPASQPAWTGSPPTVSCSEVFELLTDSDSDPHESRDYQRKRERDLGPVHTYAALGCAALSVAALHCLFSVGQVHEYLLLLLFNTKVKKASHVVAGKPRDAAVNFKRYEVCSSSSTAEVAL